MYNEGIIYKGETRKKVIDGNEHKVFPFVGCSGHIALGVGLGYSDSDKIGPIWGLANDDEQTLIDMWRAMKILDEMRYLVIRSENDTRVNDIYGAYETARGVVYGSVLAQLGIEKLDELRKQVPKDLSDKIKSLSKYKIEDSRKAVDNLH